MFAFAQIDLSRTNGSGENARVCDDEFPGSFFKNGKTKKVEVEKLELKLKCGRCNGKQCG